MFYSDIQKVTANGVIHLVVKRAKDGHIEYYGDRIEDYNALIAILGKGSFFEEEYDKALETVSIKWQGIGFETTDNEQPDNL